MQFILTIKASLLQSSVSHDPKEIILICRFWCSWNITYYYQCWKRFVVLLNIFVHLRFKIIWWISFAFFYLWCIRYNLWPIRCD